MSSPIKTGALTIGCCQDQELVKASLLGQVRSTVYISPLFNGLKYCSIPVLEHEQHHALPWLCMFTTSHKSCRCLQVAYHECHAQGTDACTALDVYFSDPALGGNKIGAPAPIGGVTVDLTWVKAGTGYQNVSGAFGGANSMTVSHAHICSEQVECRRQYVVW